MKPVVLTLALAPQEASQFAINTPLRLSFSLSFPDSEAARAASCMETWETVSTPFRADRTNDLLNDLQDAKTEDERLIDFVKYGSVSMWQFLPSYLWPQFFSVVRIIDTVQRVVAQTKPSRILVIHGNELSDRHWIGCVQAVCQADRIPVTCVEHVDTPKESRVRSLLKRMARCIGYHSMLLYDIKERIFRARLRRVSLKGADDSNDNVPPKSSEVKSLVFATVARNWRAVPGEDSDRKYDEQFYPLLPRLRELGYGRFIGVDCPYDDPVTSLRILTERIGCAEPGLIWRSFYAYGRLRAWRRTRLEARRVFQRQWNVLKNDTEFSRTFRYRGVSLLPALGDDLQNAFERLLPDCAQMLAIARAALLEEKPEAVVATYETGPYQRALFIEAKRLNIPTIGLMHGMIFGNHYDYMHARVSNEGNVSGFTIADRLCVWGEFWKQNLTESGQYPKEAVVVTGQWRQAEPENKAFLAKKAHDLRTRVCHSEGDRLILVLSAAECTIDYLEKTLSVLSQSVHNKVILKLHPCEIQAETTAAIGRLGKTYAFLQIDDLSTGLTAADIVVCQASTTIAEAVQMDRPVIWANFFDIQGWKDYLKHGAVLYAASPEQLPGQIEEALFDPGTIDRLRCARQRMSADYFAVGGDPPQEVAKTIDTLVCAQNGTRDVL